MKVRVLVIEPTLADSVNIQKELAKIRCDATNVFADPDEAIVYISDHGPEWKRSDPPPPDIVLLAGRSFHVLRELKMHLPNIPVVIVTAYPQTEELRQSLALGHVGLIEKPVTAAALKELFAIYRLR